MAVQTTLLEKKYKVWTSSQLPVKNFLMADKNPILGPLERVICPPQKIHVRFPAGVSFLHEGQTTLLEFSVSSCSHFRLRVSGGSSFFISQSFGPSLSSSISAGRHENLEEKRTFAWRDYTLPGRFIEMFHFYLPFIFSRKNYTGSLRYSALFSGRYVLFCQ